MKPHVKKILQEVKRSLNDKQVEKIKLLYKTGQYTQTKLSEMFNVTLTTIHRIVNNKDYGGTIPRSHPLTKKNITEEQVKEIKILYAIGNYTQKELGKIFNLSANHIYKIISGKKWRKVAPELNKNQSNH